MKHQEIIELLPWYVNATLDEDERSTIEAHLAECRECVLEVESLSTMQAAVRKVGNEAPGPSPNLLNRALEQIDAYERAKPQEENKGRPGNRVASLWQGWWQASPAFVRSAFAFQLVLILALGTTVVYQWSHPYVTLSGPSSDQNGAIFSVSFNENASEREIRETLLEIQGKIIGGPSANNLYTIQVKALPEQTEEIERLLQILRKNQRVVRLALQTK